MSKDTLSREHETGLEAFSALVGTANKSLDKLKLKGMEKYGLAGIHLLCMRQLYNAPKGLTRAELATRLSVDRAQVTRIIGELLADGFATEVGNSSGYRKKCILTQKGNEAIKDANNRVDRIVSFVNQDIDPRQLEIFYATLEEICERLKAAEDHL